MHTIWLRIVDSDYRVVKGARVSAVHGQGGVVRLRVEEDRWVAEGVPAGRVTIAVTADTYEPETHAFTVRDEVTQVVVALRRPGQLSYSYGADRLAFTPVEDALILYVRGEGSATVLAAAAKKQKVTWKPVSPRAFSAGDDAFVRVDGDAEAIRAVAADLANAKLDIQVARVIAHGDRPAFGLTGELVVRFKNDVRRTEAERIAASVGLTIARDVRHAGNAFLLVRRGEPSYDVLKAADALRANERVEYVEPNLLFAIEPDVYVPNDPLWGQVPHLVLINVDDAWDRLDDVAVTLRGGSPNIAIAVIDLHGVTPNHPDLTANLTDGTSKLVVDTNFQANPIVAQTVAGLGGDHGTQCASSATAAFDDNRGIPGVAPNCHLIGARIGGAANAVLMADIYLWVAGFLNGSITPGFPAAPPAQAADVISSSWGSTGLALSNTIRDCFDFLTTYGRAGKGCVLCFSLGNSGYADFTNPAGTNFRAWPTYAKTIAVGASINVNPTNPVPSSIHADPNGNTLNIAAAVDTRALYSPFGATALRKPDLVSPAHTAYLNNGTIVDPIMAAVRVGTGAVDGCPGAAVCNDYALTFGGTSHATPTVAGAIALILSARPDLTWVQVRDILRQSCVRIDAAQANAIGQWQDLDGDTVIDYSRWYGAGRLDVDAAVALALDPTLSLADVYVRENLADVGAVPSGGTWWASPDIWVRQDATEAVPVLAWTDPPPHQNAKRMQDNAVFCRIRNRGTAPATTVYVRAMLTHWAGLEFLYPADFQPSTNVGGAIPSPLVPGTYLIGEVAVTNLAPGADQIVKVVWPVALVPPETVPVMGSNVKWHPCLLLEASPHDGPAPVAGPSAPVQGDNNIAQRNIAIEDPTDADADAFVGMVVGTRDKVGVASLRLDASRLHGMAALRLRFAEDDAMKQLVAGVRRAVKDRERTNRSPAEEELCGVVLEQVTPLRIQCGSCDVVVVAAPGSRITAGGLRDSVVTASLVEHRGVDVVELRGLRGQLEVPLGLPGGRYALLMLAVVGSATGDLWVTQRRGDGALSAGYGIRRIYR